MKLNKAVKSIGLCAVMVAFGASAADQGNGEINFKGSIIDAPCSIAAESANQTIDLGEVTNAALKNGGKSAPKAFNIKLEQCDTATSSSVTATFTGAASAGNKDLLGITGTASGASIAITNGAGQIIKLGEASPAQNIQDGVNSLAFSAYLQGDVASGTEGKAATIVPGDFTSVANFTLAYK
ncbi:fimbrial protein [Pantoea allii]|uniref:Type 1 fimbria pilin n=1 Tax=Pantoea allii TaxID=574096 RepID=A0A2V2BHK4_9GAMM|nr:MULTISPECIES: fimbrial protein [Pantoea]MDJ0034577.1 fimbrial protein [Pantoea allii]MDJ0087757.1 fimbrial protein [Pantoea allii]NQS86823.1 type 1 fimbrial protein [Pantoea allii]OAE07663.1 fimbria A protein [Pantoea sp. OXWO6B1]PWK97503.1 type 1 fimbria pilin [Pantoea allii]